MRRTRLFTLYALVVMVLAGHPSAAQDEEQPPIADNSFLIEEAYNQERGVVQHIFTYQRPEGGEPWAYTFTQEWPVGSQRHQLSYTLPYQQREDGSGGGFGDILLNYRYQVVGGDPTRPLAFSPRVSLILPTGSAAAGTGSKAAGLQVNLPVSTLWSSRFVSHWNLGATFLPAARNAAGDRADTTGYNAGASLVWLARPSFNVLVEAAWTRSEAVIGPGTKETGESFFISPGIRWAHNFRSGLQIVPGVAVPIGVGSSKGQTALFLYLSLEHPFTKTE